MLKVDMNLTQVDAKPHGVVALHESINMPLVSIPNIGTAPTQAYVIGLRNENNSFTVMVVLRQSENDANLIYVSDPRHLNTEQYRYEEAEGLRFVESMGFLMDDHAFRNLPHDRQSELLARTPVFAGAQKQARPTLDLVEVEEEPIAAPEILEPDPMFGGLENVPMLKGEPASPPTFERQRRSLFPAGMPGREGAGRPSVPVPPSMRPGAPVPGSGRPAARDPASTQEIKRQELLRLEAQAQAQAQAAALAAAQAAAQQRPPEPPRPVLSADAMARLGRFLSTFAVPLVLAAGLARCAHQPKPDEDLPPDTQAQLDIADSLLAQGQWADAVATFQAVLAKAPNSVPAHHGLGLAYLYLDRSDTAEVELKAALALDPKFSTGKNSLAGLYMKAARCAEAEALLREVVQDVLYATPEFAQDNLARAESCVGKHQEAQARLTRLLGSKPQFCRGYLTLADVSAAAKTPEVTIKACEDFTARCEHHEHIGKLVSPEHRALCALRKGMAQAALGDVDAARESLAQCDSQGSYGQECRRSLELLEGR